MCPLYNGALGDTRDVELSIRRRVMFDSSSSGRAEDSYDEGVRE
jgi:hypothetical protein